MIKYSLRYADGDAGDTRLAFEAVSVDAALKFVRKTATGEWAVLYEDGKPICRMQAMEDDVWRIACLEEGD